MHPYITLSLLYTWTLPFNPSLALYQSTLLPCLGQNVLMYGAPFVQQCFTSILYSITNMYDCVILGSHSHLPTKTIRFQVMSTWISVPHTTKCTRNPSICKPPN